MVKIDATMVTKFACIIGLGSTPYSRLNSTPLLAAGMALPTTSTPCASGYGDEAAQDEENRARNENQARGSCHIGAPVSKHLACVIAREGGAEHEEHRRCGEIADCRQTVSKDSKVMYAQQDKREQDEACEKRAGSLRRGQARAGVRQACGCAALARLGRRL